MDKLYMALKLKLFFSPNSLLCVSLIKIQIPKGKKVRFSLFQNGHIPICPFAKESGSWWQADQIAGSPAGLHRMGKWRIGCWHPKRREEMAFLIAVHWNNSNHSSLAWSFIPLFLLLNHVKSSCHSLLSKPSILNNLVEVFHLAVPSFPSPLLKSIGRNKDNLH